MLNATAEPDAIAYRINPAIKIFGDQPNFITQTMNKVLKKARDAEKIICGFLRFPSIRINTPNPRSVSIQVKVWKKTTNAASEEESPT